MIRLEASLLVLALLIVGCGGTDDLEPGEPFEFDLWIGGAELRLGLRPTGEHGPAESSGLTEWTATITSVDWPDARDLSIGESIRITIREKVDLESHDEVTAIINSVDYPDTAVHLVLLILDEDLMPLPGNLEVGVQGFEAAIAATGIEDRSAAIDAVLDEYTR